MENDAPALLSIYCKAADFDAVTGQCAAPFYGPASTGLPPLSMDDAWPIAAGIAMLWGVGFVIRSMRRTTNN